MNDPAAGSRPSRVGGKGHPSGGLSRQGNPVRNKAEQAQGMKGIGILFCSLLFGTGALMVVLHILFD